MDGGITAVFSAVILSTWIVKFVAGVAKFPFQLGKNTILEYSPFAVAVPSNPLVKVNVSVCQELGVVYAWEVADAAPPVSTLANIVNA